MSSPVSARLTPMQAALLPNHDPMVGRVVGQIFKMQAFNEKPERVTLSGQLDGSERIHLTYSRQTDGSVKVEGVVAGLEVQEEIAPMQGDRTGGSFFGVGGDVTNEQQAQLTGTVGGQNEELKLSSQRETREVPLSEELKQRGQHSMTWGTRVTLTPSFGGDGVQMNMMPGQFPTPSTPLLHEDAYAVRGKVGDVEIDRRASWSTTTWTVSSNNREGWGYTEIYMAQEGAASQVLRNKQESLAVRATPYTVEKNVVTAQGFLELTRGQAREQVAFTTRYQQIPEKAAVQVDSQIGTHTLSFSIFPEGALSA
ncbi:hypothetical protein DYH09_05225 [bacterium CPR1]|nr:hypothetical protein [bacterium CPR1]